MERPKPKEKLDQDLLLSGEQAHIVLLYKWTNITLFKTVHHMHHSISHLAR